MGGGGFQMKTVFVFHWTLQEKVEQSPKAKIQNTPQGPCDYPITIKAARVPLSGLISILLHMRLLLDPRRRRQGGRRQGGVKRRRLVSFRFLTLINNGFVSRRCSDGKTRNTHRDKHDLRGSLVRGTFWRWWRRQPKLHSSAFDPVSYAHVNPRGKKMFLRNFARARHKKKKKK